MKTKIIQTLFAILFFSAFQLSAEPEADREKKVMKETEEEQKAPVEKESDEKEDTKEADASEDKKEDSNEQTDQETSAEKFTRPDGLTGKATLLGGNKTGARQSGKAEEYRDLPQGTSGSAQVKYKKGQNGVEIKADKIGRDDQSIELRADRYGTVRATASFNEIPHNYAFDVKQIYSGVGTNYLFIPPADKVVNNSTTNESGANARNRWVNIADLADQHIIANPPVDIALKRKQGAIKLDYVGLDPFRASLSWNHEDRTGTQPGSGGFNGQSNAIDFPMPVNYTTNNYKFMGEYASKHIYASASYDASKFDNHYENVFFDNPFSTSPTVGTGPTVTGTNCTQTTGVNCRFNFAGPTLGRLSLYPSNVYQGANGTLIFKALPLKTTIDLSGTAGWLRQDGQLGAFTTNPFFVRGTVISSTSIVPIDMTNPYSVMRPTARQGAHTQMGNAVITSRPFHILKTRLRYKVYDYINTSEDFIAPSYVVMDSSYSATPVKPEKMGFKKRTGSADADFQIFEKTNFIAGYSNEWMTREERESHQQHEDTYSGTLDQRFKESSLVGVTVKQATRVGDYDPYKPFLYSTLSNPGFYLRTPGASPVVPGVNPYMRKFDEANRDRKEGDIHANIDIGESFNIGTKVIGARDSYPDSAYGLQRGDQRTYTIDTQWTPFERLTIGGFYQRDRFEVEEKSRSWSCTGAAAGCVYVNTNETLPTNSASDWTALRRDSVWTSGIQIQISIQPKTLILHLSAQDSITTGQIKYVSPIGDITNLVSLGGVSSSNVDTSNYYALQYPTVYDNRYVKYQGRLEWNIDELTSFNLGDNWERFTISDYASTLFDYAPHNLNTSGTTPLGAYNGVIAMDTYPKPYKVNLVYVTFSRKF